MKKHNFGTLVKDWRTKRKMSQMDLAHVAGISTKHLSFLETGKAAPSREMVDVLGIALEIPLREQNDLLHAAGFSASREARDINDPSMWAAKETIHKIITSHSPYPALAVDRHWNLVMANDAAMNFMKIVDGDLLDAQVNVLRITLHPKGLAAHIVNYHQWKKHLLERLEHEYLRTQDQMLRNLIDELIDYPEPKSTSKDSEDYHDIAVPFVLRVEGKELTFISTITVFGSPNDVTLSEIALETFFPANEETKKFLT